jgi:hypothetical protein
MDKDEKIALKIACIQAAATLLAPLSALSMQARNNQIAADTGSCARYARDLFGKLTGESWD